MTGENKKKLFGLSSQDKADLLSRIQERRGQGKHHRTRLSPLSMDEISDDMVDFGSLPEAKGLDLHLKAARKLGIEPPYFLCHDRMAKDVTLIEGKEYLNFSTYDYLDLNGHPEVNRAAAESMERYGTSASASRLVSGERPPHRELETELAALYGTEDAVAFVSGHSANVWTLFQLFSRNDLIIHDALAHNSIVQGARFSGANRLSFPHNDLDRLEALLRQHRSEHQRAIIVIEGLYSMDGDLPDLPGIVDLKERYKCFLMVDEAHSLGVVGPTGKGVAEHFGIDPARIDIWMGTLSKTLCGCGGFIAGSRVLVAILKYTAPGFVYSVGMSPALASASCQALRLFRASPERVEKLQKLGRFFLEHAARLGLDTGLSHGFALIPVILGSSLLAGLMTSRLLSRGINVMPIIYPVVEEKGARLRFFLSSAHDESQIRTALDICAEELPIARAEVDAFIARQENASAPKDNEGRP